nr:reverse transcriptase domain-containing protein [Tanacetum cinerariifolium]
MLAVVYAFEKFRSYLIMNKSIVYTDHSALKYLFDKKDAKARLLRWILLLQEFDFKVIDTKGSENYAADHLSRLENPYENIFDPKEINETFPLESLNKLLTRTQVPRGLQTLQITTRGTSLSREFDFKVIGTKGAENFATDHLSRLENPYKNVFDPKEINDTFPLESLNKVSHQDPTGKEAIDIPNACHSGPTEGHYRANYTVKKVFDSVGENRALWSDKLEDALWAFRTAFKTPVGCTPYRLVYGKACHLPLEIKHKAFWALKHSNFDLKTIGDHRKLQLNELNELRDQAYENSLIYKERIKKLHDEKIKNRIFNVGDQVLLFNSRLKIFSGKLKSCWSGPFTISEIYPYRTAKLVHPDGCNFKVNCHRLKHYHRGDPPPLEIPDDYSREIEAFLCWNFCGLQYLTFTRSDNCYAVQQICLHMHDPQEPHLAAFKRVLRYIHGTLDHGLQLHVSSTSQLNAYTDADWAGCPVTLSRSSAEAEYRRVANVVAETAWIRNLLRELHTPLFTTTHVYCDNVSAVYMSTNPVQHQRTKHIEIDIRFVRDMVARGQVRVLHVPSRYQYADIFTKSLPTALFEEFRTSLSVSVTKSGYVFIEKGWCRNTAIRAYEGESGGCILADMMDRWFWALEGSGEFTITSVRKMIDDFMLPEESSKTRWIKAIPIK